jgi:Tol biopolymer transport system component
MRLELSRFVEIDDAPDHSCGRGSADRLLDEEAPVSASLPVRRAAALLCALLTTVVFAHPPAHAAYPGKNGNVVFARNGSLIRQTPAGAEKVLVSGLAHSPSFSANGKKIVYLKGNAMFGPGWDQIWTMNADGTGKKRLTPEENKFTVPSFSPNGARIMYTLSDGNPLGYRRLHTMKVDGSDVREFAPGVDGSMEDGVWSPDGTKVAYVGATTETLPVLRTIKATGAKDSVKTLSTTAKNAGRPDWAPNGKRLVFTRRVSNTFSVLRINADGSGLKKLADYGADTGAMEPVWSPDATRIMFDRSNFNGGTNPSLWTMKPDGTGKTRIDTNGFGASWQPRP